MANSVDFRADQVQTSKIIVTGSTPQKTLLIYGIDADDSPANQGNIDQTVFDTSVIGSDVFLFVSGGINARGGSDPWITAFGGDLHISGNLTVDGTVPGGPSFFTEIALDAIQTTGSVAMTYLSASAGAEITGSLTQGSAGNVASGQYSHAEGNSTTASGQYSHAEGSNTIALGNVSHAAGTRTIASGSSQMVIGKYNTRNNDFSLFVVGNGTDDDDISRSDVFRVNNTAVQVTGSFEVLGGITGSLSGTVAGDPFIVAGSNITANYNSLGQWEITGSGGVNFWTAIDSSNIYTTSSIEVARLSASLGAIVTGSLIASKITGSLSGTVAGNPFIVAGSNITASYNSLGQWEISTTSPPAGLDGSLKIPSDASWTVVGTGTATATSGELNLSCASAFPSGAIAMLTTAPTSPHFYAIELLARIQSNSLSTGGSGYALSLGFTTSAQNRGYRIRLDQAGNISDRVNTAGTWNFTGSSYSPGLSWSTGTTWLRMIVTNGYIQLYYGTGVGTTIPTSWSLAHLVATPDTTLIRNGTLDRLELLLEHFNATTGTLDIDVFPFTRSLITNPT